VEHYIGPTGANFRLLGLAADGVLFEGFTIEVVGMEFVRNALEGLGGVQYEIAVVDEFLEMFGALFDPERVATSPVGRSLRNGPGFITGQSARSSIT